MSFDRQTPKSMPYLVRSNSRFLLVSFQLKHILANPANIRSTFPSLPRNVPDAYRDIIERIKNGENRAIAFKILSWVLFAKRVLLMGELQEALSVEDGMKTLIPKTEMIHPQFGIQCCESLVTHDEDTQTVRLTHYTLRDFLDGECKVILLSSVEIAKACLTYLGLDEFEVPCYDEELVRLRLETYQFADYAVRFGGVHAQGDAEPDDDILRLVLQISATASRTTSLLEIKKFPIYVYYNRPIDETALHYASRYGLATICKRLLYER
jgi:hypothetical protein